MEREKTGINLYNDDSNVCSFRMDFTFVPSNEKLPIFRVLKVNRSFFTSYMFVLYVDILIQAGHDVRTMYLFNSSSKVFFLQEVSLFIWFDI